MKNNFKTNCQKLIAGTILGVFIFGLSFSGAQAYKVEDLFGQVDKGDIVISGGKSELIMKPGETTTFNIAFSNRLGKTENFKIITEDFGIDSDEESIPGSATGKDKSPYSLKDYITPEVSEFTLDNMKKIRMPVTVTIPTDTRVGSLSGAVIFSLKEPIEKTTGDGGKIAIENRLAYQVYIRIQGNEDENGYLKSFSVKSNFFEYGPVPMQFKYENDGNVYMVPSGVLTIKNMLGKIIDQVEVGRYFVQPETIKTRTEKFDRKFLFGKYTAKLELKRGYQNEQDIIDTKTISFWVIPWKLLLIIFIAVVLVLWIISLIMSKYKVTKRYQK